MKALVLAAGLLLALISPLAAQVSPPAPVQAEFQNAFPDISPVEWTQEKTLWRSRFELDGHPASAVYTAAGIVVLIEQTLNESDIPENVHDAILKKYPGASFTEIHTQEKPSQGPRIIATLNVGGSKKVTHWREDGSFVLEEGTAPATPGATMPPAKGNKKGKN